MTPWAVAETIFDGPLLFAFGIALAAGVVSFFSPCVIPLVPGYLSYVTGLGVSEVDGGGRGRLLAGSTLFVLGFSAVFVSFGTLFGAIGFRLLAYEREVSLVMGSLIIVLGLAFMGAVPWLNREATLRRVPSVGVGAAPFLGALFAIGWTPCIGPALGAVLLLSSTPDGGGEWRGAILTVGYCIGLGVPFILAALGFGRFLRVSAWAARHRRTLMFIGGFMFIAVGVLLVSGWWAELMVWMRQQFINDFVPVI